MDGTVEPPCVDISVVSRATDGWDGRTSLCGYQCGKLRLVVICYVQLCTVEDPEFLIGWGSDPLGGGTSA